ncbi:hypothetical protein [Methanobrevibacter gottschalkii]|uniref:hypothetical protein n=1 Tax=Methanobrevibacter gottschalkii TaxID=190974 RepID=UPI0026F08D87|nr:hypothetical protein [Methanobrevibacter gottschalkii]
MEENNMANAILGAVLSFLIPGLGQAYAGDIKKGAIFFAIALVLSILVTYVINLGNIGMIISLAYGVYAAYDAYKMIE